MNKLLFLTTIIFIMGCGVKAPPQAPLPSDDENSVLVDDKDSENQKKKSKK